MMYLPESWKTRVDTPSLGCRSSHFSVGFTGRALFELDGRIGTNEIKSIFPEDKRPFDFPKPTELIEELLSFTTGAGDLILDSFGGSGTTANAVLKLNRADGQSRRFILVEMKDAIATGVIDQFAGVTAQMAVGVRVGCDALQQHRGEHGRARAAGRHVGGEMGQGAGDHAGRGLFAGVFGGEWMVEFHARQSPN
jgi:hypothetical protein